MNVHIFRLVISNNASTHPRVPGFEIQTILQCQDCRHRFERTFKSQLSAELMLPDQPERLWVSQDLIRQIGHHFDCPECGRVSVIPSVRRGDFITAISKCLAEVLKPLTRQAILEQLGLVIIPASGKKPVSRSRARFDHLSTTPRDLTFDPSGQPVAEVRLN